jgi:hypothetical protein
VYELEGIEENYNLYIMNEYKKLGENSQSIKRREEFS